MTNTKRTILFVSIFAFIGFIALQIPVAQLIGSKVKFTIYDAFAPIAGAFIGTAPGILAVFFMQVLNFLAHGAIVQDAGTIIRFFPILFAAYYFARKDKGNILVPLIAIAVFLAHPVGRTVWYFTLFWTIPILAYFLRDKFLLARAFGATFTAHAVGGALWIWTFSLPTQVWQSLIPIVAAERFLFAVGISVSFVLVNNVLCFLEKKHVVNCGLTFDPRYLLSPLRQYYEKK
ncbi:hypothetical protein HY732_01740 [Candidatus Uhrbacteria bacterium]|nr:hypothetical protein [Candidatus Uhrbacteria bacterium]